MTGNIIAGIVLVLIVLYAINRVRTSNQKGAGCCVHEEDVQKVRVTDRNKKHYPYQVDLAIGGMTCENCARRVENALNELPGTWAKVDIGSKHATVLLKNTPDEGALRQAVTAAGYSVSDMKLL